MFSFYCFIFIFVTSLQRTTQVWNSSEETYKSKTLPGIFYFEIRLIVMRPEKKLFYLNKCGIHKIAMGAQALVSLI